MSLYKAFTWVRGALGSKQVNAGTPFYLVKDGYIHTYNYRMWAAHPFPVDLCYCAHGEPTEALLSRLGEPVKVSLGDHHVTYSNGLARGRLKLDDPDKWPLCKPEGVRLPLPERLLPALAQLRPFVSDDISRPWARCMLAANNTLYATTNVAVCAAPEIDLDDIRVMIPSWAIDFVLDRQQGLTHWSHADNHLGFHWDSGAWLRVQLLVDSVFPARIEDVINEVPEEAKNVLTAEWLKAFDLLAELSHSIIDFHADHMTGDDETGTMATTIEINTPVPETRPFSRWNPKYLKPVMGVATHFDPSYYPGKCPFRGDGIVGVVVGILT